MCRLRQGLLFDLTITGGVTTSDGGTNAKVYPASSGITPDRILAGEVHPPPLAVAGTGMHACPPLQGRARLLPAGHVTTQKLASQLQSANFPHQWSLEKLKS